MTTPRDSFRRNQRCRWLRRTSPPARTDEAEDAVDRGHWLQLDDDWVVRASTLFP